MVTVHDLLVTPVSSPLSLVAPRVADSHQLHLTTSSIDLRTEVRGEEGGEGRGGRGGEEREGRGGDERE